MQGNTRPCNLAIVVPEMLPVPPVNGGAIEHWVYETAMRLEPKLFNVTVISRPAGTVENHHVRYLGIPWKCSERFFYWIKERVSKRNPLRYFAKIQNVFSYGRRVSESLHDFDVIVIHNEPNLLLLANKQPGQKIILHMHNAHLNMRVFRWLYRKALAKADQVICVSDYIQKAAIKHFPEYTEKFCVLINATDPNVFHPLDKIQARNQMSDMITWKKQMRYVLYVGRLTQEKGVDVLIEAFKQVLKSNPNTQLIITGSSFFGHAPKSPFESNLIRMAENIRESILFTGFIPHHQLKYLYNACDLLVVPSVWQDPCPLVVLEGMASGSPVIASKVGGIPEMIDDEFNGLLVPPNQPIALAEQINRCLHNADLMQKLSSAAREKVIKHHTWDVLVSGLENIILHSKGNHR